MIPLATCHTDPTTVLRPYPPGASLITGRGPWWAGWRWNAPTCSSYFWCTLPTTWSPLNLEPTLLKGIPILHMAIALGASPWFSTPPGGGTPPPGSAPCEGSQTRYPTQRAVTTEWTWHRISPASSDLCPPSTVSTRGGPTPSMTYICWRRLMASCPPPLTWSVIGRGKRTPSTEAGHMPCKIYQPLTIPPSPPYVCTSSTNPVLRGRCQNEANSEPPRGGTCHSRGSGGGGGFPPKRSLLYPTHGGV